MDILKIKMDSDQVVSLRVRAMQGEPPAGTGNVYVLMDDNGKQAPASFKATEGRNVEIGFFDCVEVFENIAYAYRFYERKRLDKIGVVVIS